MPLAGLQGVQIFKSPPPSALRMGKASGRIARRPQIDVCSFTSEPLFLHLFKIQQRDANALLRVRHVFAQCHLYLALQHHHVRGVLL